MREFGVVKYFNADRGYGFLAPDRGGKDVFLHVRQIESANLGGSIEVGDRLSFEQGASRDGRLEAVNIERAR